MGKPLIQFRNPRTGETFLAHPVQFLAGMTAPSIEPWAHDPDGVPGIWVNDTDFDGQADWVDDPKRGFFTERIYRPVGATGVQGSVNGVRYRFGSPLQFGKNVVVYQLVEPATGQYLVYGIPRILVDAWHAWQELLGRLQQGATDITPEQVIAAADEMLEIRPEDHSAHFYRGVFLLAMERYAEAHAAFGEAHRASPRDQLTLLYDAAALAQLGDLVSAMKQVAKADTLRHITEGLGLFSPLADALRAAVEEARRREPDRVDLQQLHEKYFVRSTEPPRSRLRGGAQKVRDWKGRSRD